MEKLLDWENSHLYNKLGLRWKLARQRCDSTLMMEYVSYVNKVDVVQGVNWGSRTFKESSDTHPFL